MSAADCASCKCHVLWSTLEHDVLACIKTRSKPLRAVRSLPIEHKETERQRERLEKRFGIRWIRLLLRPLHSSQPCVIAPQRMPTDLHTLPASHSSHLRLIQPTPHMLLMQPLPSSQPCVMILIRMLNPLEPMAPQIRLLLLGRARA